MQEKKLIHHFLFAVIALPYYLIIVPIDFMFIHPPH